MLARTPILRALGALLLLALVTGACGGGTSDEDQAYIDALVASADDDFPPGADINCIAEGIVSGVGGASALENDYGLSVEEFGSGDIDVDMSEDDAVAVADNIWECDGMADSFFADIAGTDDEETVGCLTDNISDDNIKALLASSFMGDAGANFDAEFEQAFEEEIIAAASTCGLG